MLEGESGYIPVVVHVYSCFLLSHKVQELDESGQTVLHS